MTTKYRLVKPGEGGIIGEVLQEAKRPLGLIAIAYRVAKKEGSAFLVQWPGAISEDLEDLVTEGTIKKEEYPTRGKKTRSSQLRPRPKKSNV